MRNAIAAFALGLALHLATPAHAGEPTESDNKTIVFVCLHGSAASQVAAAHFNKIASEQSLPYVAGSRGIEINSSIPIQIRDGLGFDGLAPLNDVPKSLTTNEATAAAKLVAFDTIPDNRRGEAEVSHWGDVPPVMRDYAAARDAIVHRIDNLVPTLVRQSRPQEKLLGMITAVDQRSDRITLQVDSVANSDFKVQDGLIFDAVRNGDRVEITVESIRGVKTIVGLKKL